jgi:succinate dehydrogenase/fumarate reductase cytochrome b subunit
MIGLHMRPWLDLSLLFFLCFHVAYGLRLMLIDLGATWDRFLFWFFTVLALISFSALYWALYVI